MGHDEKHQYGSIDVEAATGRRPENESSLEKTASNTNRYVHSNTTPSRNIIKRFLARVRTSDSLPNAPPPDGGFRAWFMASLALLVNLNTWGFVNSFGAFQTYYVDVMHIGANSAVSWIGSLLVFFVFGIGILSGRAFDAGYFKLLFFGGSSLAVFGFFMLSLCTTYWQVFLAHAVCIGIGMGIAFSPSTTLSSTYFSHAKRSVALAIVVSGASIGGLVYPTIANELLPKIGFAWTIRTMGFMQLAINTFCGIMMTVSSSRLWKVGN
jgi:MFS family permease